MLEIRLNLGAIRRRQASEGADARIEGLVMLHPQGVREVEIAHEHESEDGLARQIKSEQESNFFEGARVKSSCHGFCDLYIPFSRYASWLEDSFHFPPFDYHHAQ